MATLTKPKKWTREKVLISIQAIIGKGEPINCTNLLQNYPGLYDAIRRYFVNWENGMRTAGFDPKKEGLIHRPHQWRRMEGLIQKLWELKQNNESINSYSLQRFHHRLYNALIRQFGSWENAVTFAGFDPEQERRKVHYWEEEDLLSLLINQHQNGQLLNWLFLKKLGMMSIIQRHFGSRKRAIYAAGIDPGNEQKVRKWTKERIIQFLQQLKQQGQRISPQDLWRKYDQLCRAMKREFGDYDEALKSAGFDPEQERQIRYWTKEKIIQELIKLKQQGESLSGGNLQKQYLKLYSAMRRMFGNRTLALKAAGIDSDLE